LPKSYLQSAPLWISLLDNLLANLPREIAPNCARIVYSDCSFRVRSLKLFYNLLRLRKLNLIHVSSSGDTLLSRLVGGQRPESCGETNYANYAPALIFFNPNPSFTRHDHPSSCKPVIQSTLIPSLRDDCDDSFLYRVDYGRFHSYSTAQVVSKILPGKHFEHHPTVLTHHCLRTDRQDPSLISPVRVHPCRLLQLRTSRDFPMKSCA